jgi:hypothetical protein
METPTTASAPILQALRALVHPPADHAQRKPAKPKLPPAFCAEGTLPLDALALDVQGLGRLTRPLDAASAKTLQAASKPARHGLREATRLDRRVRDTGEIDAHALTLHWHDGALPALLADVAQHLGLQALQAHVHKLLVYGPGQFFKPHQDTEKHPGMVATLVLVWPSAHIGGELQVRHGDAQKNFASQHLQATGLRWFAFYADCRHEVLHVAEGWRVVLTLDLVVPPDSATTAAAPADPALAAALQALFDTPDGPRPRPWVFLLEHQYTEHGLRWPLLKGDDRAHVHALRAAAQALGLTMHLALAQIHESWTAIVQPGRRGRAEEPEADELIAEDMQLDFWVDADDRQLHRKALSVSLADAQGFSDTDEAYLVDEAYEGYMGNYGETLDFWYRRAALVLQTPAAAESSRFVAEFDAALADALALARRPGRSEPLAARLAAAAEALQRQCSAQGRALLSAYAELACALPDAAQARTLCAGFRWATFEPEDATALARLAERWGADWVRELLEQAWARRSPSPWHQRWDQGTQQARLWPRPLPAFLLACASAGVPAALRDAMVGHTLALLAEADAALAKVTPARRQASLPQRLQAVSDLAQALGPWSPPETLAQQRLLAHVRAQPVAYPPRSLAPLWRVLPAGDSASPAVGALQMAVVQALQQVLTRPEPAPEDHSLQPLEIEWACRCADCAPVIEWAHQSTAQPLTLALAALRRNHVEAQLQAAAAPIGTQTLKHGSPHKLVLSKPQGLAALRAQQRQAWSDALAALAQAAG